MDYYAFTGSSENTKQEKIWLQAKRFNQQSKAMNGAVTCKVYSKREYKPLPLT